MSDREAQKSSGRRAVPVVTFSHFLPKPKLYYGNPTLTSVMGCLELGEQVRLRRCLMGPWQSKVITRRWFVRPDNRRTSFV